MTINDVDTDSFLCNDPLLFENRALFYIVGVCKISVHLKVDVILSSHFGSSNLHVLAVFMKYIALTHCTGGDPQFCILFNCSWANLKYYSKCMLN